MVTEHFIQEHYGPRNDTSQRHRGTRCVALLLCCVGFFSDATTAQCARKITFWEFSATAQWQGSPTALSLSAEAQQGQRITLHGEELCGRAELKEHFLTLELGTWREHRRELTHPDAPAPRDCVIRANTRLKCPQLPCAPTNATLSVPAAPLAPKGWVNLSPTTANQLQLRDVRIVSTDRSM